MRVHLIAVPCVLIAAWLAGCQPGPDFLRRYPSCAEDPDESRKPREKPLPLERETLTLQEAVSLALERNPELAAARAAIDQSAARIIQAGLWPNPTLEIEAEGIPRKHFGFDRSENTASLGQEFPLGGKLSARTTAAQREEELASLEYENKLREVVAGVKASFFKVLAAQLRIETVRNTRELAESLHEVAKKRVDAGVSPETELIKARIELSQTGLALAEAERAFSLATRRLNAAIGVAELRVGAFQGVLREACPALDPEELKSLVVENHPGLAACRKGVDLARSQLEVALSDRYPDIGLRFGYGTATEEDEEGHWTRDYFYVMGLELPLPLFDRNQGGVLEARSGIIQARHDYQAAETIILFELDQALAEYDRASAEARVYREAILSEAEHALELVKAGYEQGKFSYLELLDAQRTLAETREAYVDTLEALNAAAAEVERLAGEPLEQLK